ncbi:hypothetical protein L7F22_068559 [Adiantum nelumboides]|nr:hypothetical protein [Adiantum nelumboides]
MSLAVFEQKVLRGPSAAMQRTSWQGLTSGAWDRFARVCKEQALVNQFGGYCRLFPPRSRVGDGAGVSMQHDEGLHSAMVRSRVVVQVGGFLKCCSGHFGEHLEMQCKDTFEAVVEPMPVVSSLCTVWCFRFVFSCQLLLHYSGFSSQRRCI